MWDVDGLLHAIPYPLLREWRIYFTLKESDADPELTKWDTEETAQAKIKAKALREVEAAQARNQGR